MSCIEARVAARGPRRRRPAHNVISIAACETTGRAAAAARLVLLTLASRAQRHLAVVAATVAARAQQPAHIRPSRIPGSALHAGSVHVLLSIAFVVARPTSTAEALGLVWKERVVVLEMRWALGPRSCGMCALLSGGLWSLHRHRRRRQFLPPLGHGARRAPCAELLRHRLPDNRTAGLPCIFLGFGHDAPKSLFLLGRPWRAAGNGLDGIETGTGGCSLCPGGQV